MADALASGASIRKDVGVQVPSRPPKVLLLNPDLQGVRRQPGRLRLRRIPASPQVVTGAVDVDSLALDEVFGWSDGGQVRRTEPEI